MGARIWICCRVRADSFVFKKRGPFLFLPGIWAFFRHSQAAPESTRGDCPESRKTDRPNCRLRHCRRRASPGDPARHRSVNVKRKAKPRGTGALSGWPVPWLDLARAKEARAANGISDCGAQLDREKRKKPGSDLAKTYFHFYIINAFSG